VTEDTLLLRQIHPAFNQNGEVTSQAFRPSAEHGWRLSVYDGDQITPEAAWTHFTTVQQKHSSGVMSVTVKQCAELDLPVKPSPEVFKEHCDIDFSAHNPKTVERKSKLLRDKATARGWQFRPS
jgi:hypothetical protein